MNRRRHHAEEDSSLELLLDTMCNTFGGVMFIAISLFIIISAFPPEKNENSVSPPELSDPTELCEELERLKALLKTRQAERQIMEEQLKRQQDAPLQRMRQELALLERMMQEEEIRQRTDSMLLVAKLEEVQKLTDAMVKLETQIQSAEQRKDELEVEKMRLSDELAATKAHPVEKIAMEFKVMEKSLKDPFFIILSGTEAWPVGPWRDGNGDRPDDAVSSRKDGNSVFIKPVPGKGVPVLSGNEISREFQELLRKIPSERVPDFYFYSTSAATVSRLREILKRQSVMHGCIPAVSDAEDFSYQYVQDAHYEY